MKKLVMIFAAALALLLLAACGVPASSQSLAPSSTGVEPVSLSEPEAFSEPTPESRPAFDSAEAWEGENPSALCTGWHAGSGVGSGYATRYLLLSDGTFYYSKNEMTMTARLLYMDGTWCFKDDVLCLEVHRKVVVEGGEILDGDPVFGSWISGGVHRKIELQPNEYEEILLPVEITDAGEYSPYPNSILLDGVQYWDATGVLYDDMPDAWDLYVDGDPSDKFV